MKRLADLMLLESARLAGYLGTLAAGDWRQPSACDLWDVGDVVAHLSLAVDAYTNRLARGLASDTSPSEGLPPAGSVNPGSWSEFGAARVISFREGVRGDLLSQFRKANERFHGLLSKLEAAEWETFCYHPGKLVPANTLARFMILELSVHGQLLF